MPSEQLKNSARLSCIRNLYKVERRDAALRGFEELVSSTPLKAFALFRAHATVTRGDRGEFLCLSSDARAVLGNDAPPPAWVAALSGHDPCSGAIGSAILRLDCVARRRAAGLLLESRDPGGRVCFAVLSEADGRLEALMEAIEEWAWLIVVGGRLLLDRFPARDGVDDGDALTGSEIRVLAGLARGLSPEQIADQTGRSLSTVRNQLKSARNRLGARSTAGALAIAIRTRQIPI